MKHVCIYFLAFLTLWMSTWLVTDVHEWSMFDAQHTHTVISSQQTPLNAVAHTVEHEHHEGVCSYDHDGHIGQVLASVVYSTPFVPTQKSIHIAYSNLWYTQSPSPNLRPPIV